MEKGIYEIYGIKIALMVDLLVQNVKEWDEGFIHYVCDETKLMIYFGDCDVSNSYIVFKYNPENVRTFSSEGKFSITSVDLIMNAFGVN